MNLHESILVHFHESVLCCKWLVLQSDLHNFADDNTISAISDTISGLVNSLIDSTEIFKTLNELNPSHMKDFFPKNSFFQKTSGHLMIYWVQESIKQHLG